MTPRKILAIKLRALGDTVLLTASLAELRLAYPKSEIHVLVTDRWAPLLERHPAVNRVIPYTRRKSAAARAKTVAQMAFKLRAEKFDLAVNFHASPSSATLAFASGAPRRAIHFHGHKDKNRYSTVAIPGKGTVRPAIERDMDCIRALGIPAPEGRLPKIHLSDLEMAEGRSRIASLGLSGPILALGLGASRPTKVWPAQRFAQLALDWVTETGGGVLGIYGNDERPLFDEFSNAASKLFVHHGSQEPALGINRIQALEPLQIRELCAVLSASSVLAGNDSGPRHLAVAAGIPTVTLFGPEDPFEWHPYPAESHPRFFVDELECRRDALPGQPPWCALQTCEIEQHRCMRMIEEDVVMKECRRLLLR